MDKTLRDRCVKWINAVLTTNFPTENISDAQLLEVISFMRTYSSRKIENLLLFPGRVILDTLGPLVALAEEHRALRLCDKQSERCQVLAQHFINFPNLSAEERSQELGIRLSDLISVESKAVYWMQIIIGARFGHTQQFLTSWISNIYLRYFFSVEPFPTLITWLEVEICSVREREFKEVWRAIHSVPRIMRRQFWEGKEMDIFVLPVKDALSSAAGGLPELPRRFKDEDLDDFCTL